ncbi:MAG: glycosyltransferase family A protein [Candidatus Sedimenticola sp. 6PFRAG1]
MSTRFSLIYPTRNRPEFIGVALKFLEQQDYDNFEVIISDNYLDESLSCEKICRDSRLGRKINYIRPSKPVGMVENWNYAYNFADGDYICYLTDKMFLLPGILSNANKVLSETNVDIFNWIDDVYQPDSFTDYFGKGTYIQSVSAINNTKDYEQFNPNLELSSKGKAEVPRQEQSKSSYTRGKICFGGFNKELCDTIIEKTGSLFHDISPDYTSMILGLSFSRSALELSKAGVVHVNTDLSNGGAIATDDRKAMQFLTSLGNINDYLNGFLVPGVYSSMNNIVAHDYFVLKNKYDLDFKFDKLNWISYILQDLGSDTRNWSSDRVKKEQTNLCYDFINSKLTGLEQKDLNERLLNRKKSSEQLLSNQTIKDKLRIHYPQIYAWVKRNFKGSEEYKLERLCDVIKLD